MDFTTLKGKKAAIIVSSGGHLLEARLLVKYLGLSPNSIYITHANKQSVSLLEGTPHAFVPNIQSRDWPMAFKASPKIVGLCVGKEFDLIISTGAAIAIAALPLHMISRLPFLYFESLTRSRAPSLTGKILEFFPTVQKFSVNHKNFHKRWKEGPSILDSYILDTRELQHSHLKILVTLGTITNYRFDRLVDLVLKVLMPNDEVIWQTGATKRTDLPGVVHEILPTRELVSLAKSCDLVVSHCGIGTVLELLSNGVRPAVLPRLAKHGEHVDDHQTEAVVSFQKSDLIEVLNDSIERHHLENAALKIVKP
jgi:UDP-N-acetylglucosamine transferase subunit ALG13